MRTIKSRFGTLALGLCLVGATASKPASALLLHLLNFQVGAIEVFQSTGGNSFSGQIAWTPFLNLGLVGVRGDFGVTLLKNGFGDEFLATNLEGLFSLTIAPMVSIEAGGGWHTWTNGNGGTNPALTANLVLGIIPGLDRIYAGYSRYFLGNGVNEIRAGIGIQF